MINIKTNHFAIQKDVDSAALWRGWKTLDGLIDNRPEGVMNLPLSTLNGDPTRSMEVECNITKTNLNPANRITHEALQG